MITHNPLHGSGRAGFPHPALTSGNDASSAQGIRMIDASRRQPAVDQATHSVPAKAMVLTAPRQRALPEPRYLKPEANDSWCKNCWALLFLHATTTGSNARLPRSQHFCNSGYNEDSFAI